MLRWLRTRISNRAERVNGQRIEILAEETRALKAELEKRNSGKPIVLSDEDQERLRKANEGIDPERLKSISVFDLDEVEDDESRQDST